MTRTAVANAWHEMENHAAGRGGHGIFARMSGMLDLSMDANAKPLRPCRRAVDRVSVRSDGDHVG